MKHLLKILCIGFLILSGSQARSQSVVWRQILGERFVDIAYNCIELHNGDYLMVGFKEIVPSGTNFTIPKSYLIRLDRYGNILWQKILGDSSTTVSKSLTTIEDPFGNFFVPYFTNSTAHLAKVDPQGNILWDRNYNYDLLTFRGMSFVNQYKNIVALGVNNSETVSITKLDTSGNVVWNKAYYDSIPIFSIYSSYNNSFIFLENSYYICGAKANIGFIIKTDTSGNVIWNKRYPSNWGIFSIAQNSENTFISSGRADEAAYLYCQKFDSSGNVIWGRSYRNDPLAGALGYYRILKNSENNFALGTTSGYNFGRLLTMDSLGVILTSKFYNYPESFYIEQNNINNTSDSGYIVAGSLDSNASLSTSSRGDKQIDILIFKIDKYGNTVSIRNNTGLPTEYNLGQNYPNPFNPTTKITYSISKSGFVKIKVYDITGKEVRTLVNESKQSGSYDVRFDGQNLSSGIYFYKLEAGEFVETKRMVLLK